MIACVPSLLLALLGGLFLVAGGATAQPAYSGLEAVAGHDLRHSSSLQNDFALHRNISGPSASCPHAFGPPLDLLDAHRRVGYDFAILLAPRPCDERGPDR